MYSIPSSPPTRRRPPQEARARLAAIAARCFAVIVALVVSASVPTVHAQSDDPAARGLDVFVLAPPVRRSGQGLELLVRTYGYARVDTAAPLGGVKIEARYEGAPVDAAPVAVSSDAEGLARVVLPPPVGQGSERVRLTLTHGEHVRAREIEVPSTPTEELRLTVPRDEVRPGETITAWVQLSDRATGQGSADAEVELGIEQGGALTRRVRARTGPAGGAVLRVRVPSTEEPEPSLALVASAPGRDVAPSRRMLVLAEQQPARPSFALGPEKSRVLPGERAEFRARLLSASGEPLVGAEIGYVFLQEQEPAPAGTLAEPKSEFATRAKRARTDARGELLVGFDTPTGLAVAQRYVVVARAQVEGKEIDRRSGAVEVTPRGTASVSIHPSARELVPGLEQALAMRVVDGWGRPIARARFALRGDGLAAEVETDARGVATVPWKVPLDVGSRRESGPCSGEVAATVRVSLVSGAPAELFGGGSVPHCVPVDRRRTLTLTPSSPIVRAGSKLALALRGRGPSPKGRAHVALAVDAQALSDSGGARVRLGEAWSTWDAGSSAGALEVPVGESAGGLAQVHALLPLASAGAETASASVLVLPRVLPSLEARQVGGRSTPGGEIALEATLRDDAGRPLAGSVAAMVLDASDFDDERFDRWAKQFDTRLGLCSLVDVGREHCDAALRGDAELVPELSLELSRYAGVVPVPAVDPGRNRSAELERAFRDVLMSLEGALHESSASPERLRDALRVGARGRSFNPELFEVVTQAMDAPPLTPGGEPFTLADLVAIDPQVDYDTVARRVARLKLFRLISEARSFRLSQRLDLDEPALGDPNALLRRWQAQGKQDMLLDPWGNRFAFVPTRGPVRAHLIAVPGFELRSPGPDGRLGTADDVSDPFQRVVRSGTPYARVMHEDRVVDALLDLRVADSSFSAWNQLLEHATGTRLGGTGSGQGSGHGRLGGSHTSKPPQIRMGATSVTRRAPYAAWLPPVEVDGSGVARLTVKLGGDETTYRIVMLATPTEGGPALTHLDVPASSPASVRVMPFEDLHLGDEIEATLRVRNRTGRAARATLEVEATGGARLTGEAKASVELPASGATSHPVRLRAVGEGASSLRAKLVVAGGPTDETEFRFDVRPDGRVVDLARARWLDGTDGFVSFASFLGEPGKELRGAPFLVLERPAAAVAQAALTTRWLEQAASREDLADAFEIYERVRRRAALDAPGSSLERRAADLARQARVRARASAGESLGGTESLFRLRRLGVAADPSDPDEVGANGCPPEVGELGALVTLIEGEPSLGSGIDACWETAVASTVDKLRERKQPALLARATLAFVDRPERRELGGELARALAREVSLRADGRVVLPRTSARSERALVLSALLASRALGLLEHPAPSSEQLTAWLSVLRGPDGGFGSLAATRAATAALLGATEGEPPMASPLRVRVYDADGRQLGAELSLSAGERRSIHPRTVRIEAVDRARAILRLEQRALVPFAAPQPQGPKGFEVELRYPPSPSVGAVGSLQVRARADVRREATATLRVPLPPGVSVAESVEGVRALSDSLIVRMHLDATGQALPVLVPLRFSHAGSFRVPPASARLDDGEDRRAESGALKLVVAR